jgi:DNA-binding ferritin-like protein
MFNTLAGDNQIILASIRDAYESAEEYDEIGLSNYLQDRYDAHKKHAWMLTSLLKRKQ